jgi:primosomal protein N' (replication factor Y)
MISKIRNQFLMSVLIKIPRGKADLAQAKATIRRTIDDILKEKSFRSARIIADVDPV